MVELSIRKVNREIVNEFKKECIVCGQNTKCCLDIHHVSNKHFNISQAITQRTSEDILNELKICVCLCANCHRKVHAGIIDLKKFI